MLLNKGELVHIVTRRMFETDLRRHFVGQVQEVSENAFRLEGYAFIFEARINQFERRPERRTRIFPLADSGLIIVVLPPEVNIDQLQYRMIPAKNKMVMTDGNYTLDINEFGSSR